MSELKIMTHLGPHLNIVNLLGACTKSGRRLVLGFLGVSGNPLCCGNFLFCFVLVFRDRVSLCSPGCPITHFVDQAGLEPRNPPASASHVLGLKACATTAQQKFLYLFLQWKSPKGGRPALCSTPSRHPLIVRLSSRPLSPRSVYAFLSALLIILLTGAGVFLPCDLLVYFYPPLHNGIRADTQGGSEHWAAPQFTMAIMISDRNTFSWRQF